MTEQSLYQEVRSDLTTLRMTAAAEALPRLLDESQRERVSHTAFLQKLLTVEVQATNAGQHAGGCNATPTSAETGRY